MVAIVGRLPHERVLRQTPGTASPDAGGFVAVGSPPERTPEAKRTTLGRPWDVPGVGFRFLLR